MLIHDSQVCVLRKCQDSEGGKASLLQSSSFSTVGLRLTHVSLGRGLEPNSKEGNAQAQGEALTKLAPTVQTSSLPYHIRSLHAALIKACFIALMLPKKTLTALFRTPYPPHSIPVWLQYNLISGH